MKNKLGWRVAQLSMMTVSPVALATMAAPAMAQSQVKQFDIPAQPLSSAILEFSRQSDVLVVVPPELTAGKRSRPLKGSMPVNEAIGQLLRGSSLRAVPNPSGGYRIDRVNGASSVAAGQRSVSGEADARSAAGNSDGAEIVVTGSNIRGVVNETQPLTVLDRKYIDRTGYATTAQLIESLPQNFALQSQSGINVPDTYDGSALAKTQGSSINLRGVGEGTTLTLLNGHRLAPGGAVGVSVDISALPLSAIERVEILTDGASALYGADAIGGVVNFILRRDYDGAEARLRAGLAAGGVKEYRLSQVFGKSWRSGNIMVSGEYYHRDLLKASERDFVPSTSNVGSLLPQENNYSITASGRQDLTDTVNIFADAIYTKRNSRNLAGPRPTPTLDSRVSTDDAAVVAATGLKWKPGGEWQIEVSGNYAKNKVRSFVNQQLGFGPPAVPYQTDTKSTITGADVRADGPLFNLPAGSVRLAIGADWRAERLDFFSAIPDDPRFPRTPTQRQNVQAAYGEIYVPVFGESNAIPGIQRLELSMAARFDKYSNFGSALSPQLGGMWEPIEGVKLRSSYGTSYKAPSLRDYIEQNNVGALYSRTFYGTSGNLLHILSIQGSQGTDYKPQRSNSISVGIEIEPKVIPGLKLSGNYYNLVYKDIIGNYVGPVLPFLVTLNPSRDQVLTTIALARTGTLSFNYAPGFVPLALNDFDPGSFDLIYDGRRQNLSKTQTNGVDLSASYTFTWGSSVFNAGVFSTIVFHRKVTPNESTPPVETAGLVFNPAKFRIRGSFGWQSDEFSANVFVNHIGPTKDTRAYATNSRVSPFSTVDLNIGYDIGSKHERGILSGVRISLSITNLLDEDPPRIAGLIPDQDIGFDSTKGNPLGRMVAVEFRKAW